MDDGHLFARFAKEKGKITRSRVHRKLFQPTKAGVLSVQKIDELEFAEIRDIGVRVAKMDKKCLYGWAELTRDDFGAAKLNVCVDNIPWCGHTTISGWPEERHARLNKQKMLAAASRGCLL